MVSSKNVELMFRNHKTNRAIPFVVVVDHQNQIKITPKTQMAF